LFVAGRAWRSLPAYRPAPSEPWATGSAPATSARRRRQVWVALEPAACRPQGVGERPRVPAHPVLRRVPLAGPLRAEEVRPEQRVSPPRQVERRPEVPPVSAQARLVSAPEAVPRG